MPPPFELLIQSSFVHLSHPEAFPALSKPIMGLYYLPNRAAADHKFTKDLLETKQSLYYNAVLVCTDLKNIVLCCR